MAMMGVSASIGAVFYSSLGAIGISSAGKGNQGALTTETAAS